MRFLIVLFLLLLPSFSSASELEEEVKTLKKYIAIFDQNVQRLGIDNDFRRGGEIAAMELAQQIALADIQLLKKKGNYSMAYKRLLEIVETDDPYFKSVAQLVLGNMTLEGQGVEKNISDAVAWYIKAAENGLSEAYSYIALEYYSGKKVQKDYRKAFHYYEKAAKAGVSQAQYMLGNLYYRGEGVQADWVKAYAWIDVAFERGVKKNSIKYHISKNLDPLQLDSAKELAKNYWKQYANFPQFPYSYPESLDIPYETIEKSYRTAYGIITRHHSDVWAIAPRLPFTHKGKYYLAIPLNNYFFLESKILVFEIDAVSILKKLDEDARSGKYNNYEYWKNRLIFWDMLTDEKNNKRLHRLVHKLLFDSGTLEEETYRIYKIYKTEFDRNYETSREKEDYNPDAAKNAPPPEPEFVRPKHLKVSHARLVKLYEDAHSEKPLGRRPLVFREGNRTYLFYRYTYSSNVLYKDKIWEIDPVAFAEKLQYIQKLFLGTKRYDIHKKWSSFSEEVKEDIYRFQKKYPFIYRIHLHKGGPYGRIYIYPGNDYLPLKVFKNIPPLEKAAEELKIRLRDVKY